jgi:L-rhamnose-H+ transport protein
VGSVLAGRRAVFLGHRALGFASLRTHDLLGVLAAAPRATLLWCWFWGAMWGFGGLTFGLTMRYLGLSLGMAVALGSPP